MTRDVSPGDAADLARQFGDRLLQVRSQTSLRVLLKARCGGEHHGARNASDLPSEVQDGPRIAKAALGRGALGQGWRTILPGMPPAAFALYALAAWASGYTPPTWGRRWPSSTRRASSVS